jgi:hypothetical protein
LKAALVAAFDQEAMVLPGSLVRREVRCGRPDCRCHSEPPRLHGPYWSWTRKVRSKTVTRLLSDEQIEDYRPWLDNARHIRQLLGELEALSVAIVEADARRRS